MLHRRLPVFRLYSGAVAQSDFAKTKLPERLRRKSTVIKGGVDLARFLPCPSPRRRTVLYVGRIIPHKGIDDLVAAFSLVDREQLELKIVGRTRISRRRYRAYTRKDIDHIPQLHYLHPDEILAMKAVSAVLPFRVNAYVIQELIHQM